MKKTELEKKLEALPPCPKKVRKWTIEQDAAILKYGEEKGFEAVARVLGLNGELVRRRARVLKAQMGK